MQHRFARWGVMFFFLRFARFFCHPEWSVAGDFLFVSFSLCGQRKKKSLRLEQKLV
jgi:hypothetical protein